MKKIIIPIAIVALVALWLVGAAALTYTGFPALVSMAWPFIPIALGMYIYFVIRQFGGIINTIALAAFVALWLSVSQALIYAGFPELVAMAWPFILIVYGMLAYILVNKFNELRRQ